MTINPIPQHSRASLAAAIAIGLTLSKGIGLLIRAAAAPLDTLTVHIINAILMRGWRNVMALSESSLPLALVGLFAFEGFVLVALALGIGMKLVPRLPKE